MISRTLTGQYFHLHEFGSSFSVLFRFTMRPIRRASLGAIEKAARRILQAVPGTVHTLVYPLTTDKLAKNCLGH